MTQFAAGTGNFRPFYFELTADELNNAGTTPIVLPLDPGIYLPVSLYLQSRDQNDPFLMNTLTLQDDPSGAIILQSRICFSGSPNSIAILGIDPTVSWIKRSTPTSLYLLADVDTLAPPADGSVLGTLFAFLK
jgi:hypothetical protein